MVTSSSTYSIYLVYEDNTRCLRLCFGEKVTNARSSNSNKHLYKVRTRHREKWYTCLSCYCLRQKGLTRSRRTHKECSLRNLSSKVGIFLRIFKKFNNLLNLLLSTLLTCYILKSNLVGIVFIILLGLALSYIEDSAHATSTSHAATHSV